MGHRGRAEVSGQPAIGVGPASVDDSDGAKPLPHGLLLHCGDCGDDGGGMGGAKDGSGGGAASAGGGRSWPASRGKLT